MHLNQKYIRLKQKYFYTKKPFQSKNTLFSWPSRKKNNLPVKQYFSLLFPINHTESSKSEANFDDDVRKQADAFLINHT